MKLLAQLNLEKKCVDAAIDKDIMKRHTWRKKSIASCYILMFQLNLFQHLYLLLNCNPLIMCHPLQLQHTNHLHPQFKVHVLLFHVGQRAQNVRLQRVQTLLTNLLLQVMQRSSFSRERCIFVSHE